MLSFVVADVLLLVLTDGSLSMTKSSIQLQNEMFTPSRSSYHLQMDDDNEGCTEISGPQVRTQVIDKRLNLSLAWYS